MNWGTLIGMIAYLALLWGFLVAIYNDGYRDGRRRSGKVCPACGKEDWETRK